MTAIEKTSGKRRRVLGNLISGIAVIVSGGVVLGRALQLQDYVTPAFLMFIMFTFLVPIAVGLAAGLVSPRRAIVWAPLWACVFTVVIYALITGAIHDSRTAQSPWRLAYMFVGLVLAALMGLAAEEINRRGNACKAAAVFLILCAAVAYANHELVVRGIGVFERSHAPEIFLAMNRDYIRLPKGLDWRCRPRPDLGCYELSTMLGGRNLSVLATTDSTRILGLNYDHRGNGGSIKDDKFARDYLKKAGFRDRLLRSLCRRKCARPSWCASLDGTRLTLADSGAVTIRCVQESGGFSR